MKIDLRSEDKQIFQSNAKTFSLACRFLGKSRARKISRLYVFCRKLDDIADESTDFIDAKETLEKIQSEIITKNIDSQIYKTYVYNLIKDGVDGQYMNELILGLISDCKGEVRLQTMGDLYAYCYRVAGTVGLMSCPLLDIKPKNRTKASMSAMHLGIAMQLTNISRDVLEDAVNNRIYIPQDFCHNHSAKALTYCPPILDQNLEIQVKKNIDLLLTHADYHYNQAKNGYCYLPFMSRVTVMIAADLYRSIGCKIRKNGLNFWNGRVCLSSFEKNFGALKSLLGVFSIWFWFQNTFTKQEKYDSYLQGGIKNV